MPSPEPDSPTPRQATPLFDVLAGVLLAGGVLALLVLPSTLFPVVLRAVPLTYAVGMLVLRFWALRTGIPGRAKAGLQEWLQLAALIGILLSLVPIPLAQTRAQGAIRHAQNERVDLALRDVQSLHLSNGVADSGNGYALTRNKAGTIRVLLILLAMHAAFGVARLISPPHRELQLWLLVSFGAAVALAGMLNKYYAPQGQTLWWIFPTGSIALPGPIACFINPNHYAAYLAMLSPCALALAIGGCQRRRLLPAASASLLLALMTLGLFVSQSRGGLLAFVVGLMSVAALCLLRGRLLAGLAITALVVGMMFSLPTLLSVTYRERLSALLDVKEDDSYHTRTQAWADAPRILHNYPLLGAGANAFRMVYPQVRTESTQARMTHAENEYVQLLTDFGLCGTTLFLAILACMLHTCGRRLFYRARDIDITTLAAAGALTVIGAHAIVDFALHISLYAVTAAALVGLSAGASSDHTPPPEAPEGIRHVLPPAILALLLSLVVVMTWGRRQHLDSSDYIRRADYAKLCGALRWAPTSPQAWQRLGEKAMKEKDLNARLFGESCLTQAGLYDPKDYTLWYDIGMARLSLGDRQGARQAQKHVQALKDWYWPEALKVY